MHIDGMNEWDKFIHSELRKCESELFHLTHRCFAMDIANQTISWDDVHKFFSNMVDFVKEIELGEIEKERVRSYLSTIKKTISDNNISLENKQYGVTETLILKDQKIQITSKKY